MKLSPVKEANRISQILDVFHHTHGEVRYPVDVKKLALDCAGLFQFTDPISAVEAADIKGFEGGLFKTGTENWTLLYNNALASPGRIRFTQAHELGHYILHRYQRESFECTSEDMLDWSEQEKGIEGEADKFASYLLMPLHDFRDQVTDAITLDALGHCADRYGVSLTATTLQWLSYTDEKAVLVMSRDGFMDWAWSSDSARKAGAYFATRRKTIQIPEQSLAANTAIRHERVGITVPAQTWFPHADTEIPLREMKVSAEQYDSTLTLLVLPRFADVWAPRNRDLQS
ncbi:ImmA/IrrE family metallo-endopeptidase [Cupriavidus sp. amp6]|uniref:ImmA/IrrE family metallo-endopeptidase n=1 Tax=Cupriavidus sp. amp6 TaxID=388051 RepID=UPI00048E3889|nr:ImmA/IrrE family metallo-endopeptidase [Cupriavidus sp. amp6]